jgi:hypothetical protein
MPFKAGHVADWPGRTGCEPLPTLDGVEPDIESVKRNGPQR